MRPWVRIYVRLRIWRRRDIWRVVKVRRHLGFVMALRAGMGKGKRLLWAGLCERMNELMWQEKSRRMGVENGQESSAQVT